MFGRLRNLFNAKPRPGDTVAVLDGPYAGKTGAVAAMNGHEFTVYIDECCQPQLTEGSLRRVRQGRRSLEPGEPEPGVNEEHEVARARIDQLPPPMN
jgi:ribosomal protein L24